jgi:hypothetical protein
LWCQRFCATKIPVQNPTISRKTVEVGFKSLLYCFDDVRHIQEASNIVFTQEKSGHIYFTPCKVDSIAFANT